MQSCGYTYNSSLKKSRHWFTIYVNEDTEAKKLAAVKTTKFTSSVSHGQNSLYAPYDKNAMTVSITEKNHRKVK